MLPTTEQTKWIHNISRATQQQYPAVDWEDIRQHLWEQWLTAVKTGAFRDYVETGDKPRILVALSRWASRYAAGESEALAVLYVDREYYSRSDLRSYLPFVELPEHWAGAPGGTALAVWADMQVAWKSLSETERDLLRERFVNPSPTPFAELAERAGKPVATVRKEVERALTRMQRVLSGAARERSARAAPIEVSGLRSVVSNSAAQGYASRSWDG